MEEDEKSNIHVSRLHRLAQANREKYEPLLFHIVMNMNESENANAVFAPLNFEQ